MCGLGVVRWGMMEVGIGILCTKTALSVRHRYRAVRYVRGYRLSNESKSVGEKGKKKRREPHTDVGAGKRKSGARCCYKRVRRGS